MATALHYLTVQDILWVNLQVTKKVHHFNFARLEEAVYYQYAYGESKTLLPQASRFLAGFLKLRPLDAANEATALVGFLAFLKVNGREINLSDEEGAEWLAKLGPKSDSVLASVDARLKSADTDHHDVDVRSAITWVLDRYPKSVAALAGTLV